MPALPRTILVAPDSFKGTFSALQVTEAIAQGVGDAGHPVDPCPVADGGEGTMSVLCQALNGRLVTCPVSDPLGRTIEAEFALLEGRRGGTRAIVEAAAASGLTLIAQKERDASAATTAGTGELIVAAAQAGAEVIYVGVGGSATTDGGAGALKAIRRAGGLSEARLIVLCDVRTPFELAARVFGPQKGAGTDEVRRLTQRLHRMARSLDRDPRGVPMTGAAGGLAGGLWADVGAELVPGAEFVLDLLQFDRRMRAARAVVGGEGRLDGQSLAGKALAEVATRARQAGVPCHAIVGRCELDAFGLRILDLQVVKQARTLKQIRSAAAKLAAEV